MLLSSLILNLHPSSYQKKYFQPSFKMSKLHALLTVTNNLLTLDRRESAVSVLSDITVAFHTVVYKMLS